MTASIAGVLFDATGTLIHLRESVGEVYSRIAREHGVDLPAWRLDDAFEHVLRHAEPRVFPSADAAEIAALEERWWYEVVRSTFLAADSSARFADATAFYAHLYRYYATVDAWKLVPGARTVLADLHGRELRLGVVSNFDQRLLDILEAFGISGADSRLLFLERTSGPSHCRVRKSGPREPAPRKALR